MYAVNCLDIQLWTNELQLTLRERVRYPSKYPLRQTGNKFQWNYRFVAAELRI